jgi:ribose 5-phosphate isomerase A
MTAKQRAATAALDYVRSDTVIGLGSGSTSECFVIALGEALKSGRLKNITGVPTSEKTAKLAREHGIPLTSLSAVPILAVTVDGADEVTPRLELIKGGGGAMLREKIVAQNSERLVIIADEHKRVAKLGTTFAVPVEVIKFEHEATARFLKTLGCEPRLRDFVTDNGNLIYDCKFPSGIDAPAKLEMQLKSRAGIVETGLFLGIASVALIADESRVDVLS